MLGFFIPIGDTDFLQMCFPEGWNSWWVENCAWLPTVHYKFVFLQSTCHSTSSTVNKFTEKNWNQKRTLNREFCSKDTDKDSSLKIIILSLTPSCASSSRCKMAWKAEVRESGSEVKQGQRGKRAHSEWRRHSELSEWPSRPRSFHVRAVPQSWFKQKTVKWSITRNELISCFVLITAQVSITFPYFDTFLISLFKQK